MKFDGKITISQFFLKKNKLAAVYQSVTDNELKFVLIYYVQNVM